MDSSNYSGLDKSHQNDSESNTDSRATARKVFEFQEKIIENAKTRKTQKKKHSCQKCPQSFDSIKHLQRHDRSHTGEKTI